MKDAGCRLLIVASSLAIRRSSKTSRRALPSSAPATSPATATSSASSSTRLHSRLPGETRESIRNTIDFAKQLDCETIQVSIAHAFPGTEFFDFAKQNGFITNEAMSDEGGHQMAHIEYPGLPVEYVMEMVHRFYDEYYFRPKAAFRVVWQAIVNRDVHASTPKPAPS